MKRRSWLVPAALFLALAGSLLITQLSMASYTFNANNLIDDSVFDYTGSMTPGQIDAFLNGFSSSCISTNNGFTAPDPTGYTPTSSDINGIYSYGSAVSAGQVIYDAAVAHQINPQVLVTTLEKEETLVSGSLGCASWRYTSATGYGCTDSGTNSHNYSYPGGGLVTPLYYINGNPVNSITGSCVNAGSKAGFSEQVVHTAWLLSYARHHAEGLTGWAAVTGSWNHCDDNNTCPASMNIPANWACYTGYMTQGTFYRCPTDSSPAYYDGYATIDNSISGTCAGLPSSVAVHMDTGATAALYVYTPHICGNYSFFNLFTGWFGSTSYAYAASVTVNTYSDAARTQPLSLSSPVTSGQKIYVTVSATNTGNKTWSNAYTRVGTVNPTDRNSVFQDSSWLWNNRAAALAQSSVAPNQTGTFQFSMTAPNTDGIYNESFGLIADGQADGWMKDSATFTLNITVSNPYNAVVTGVSTYRDSNYTLPTDVGQMTVGDTVYVRVTARNSGNQTWSNTFTKVATENPNDRTSVFSNNSWVTSNRPALLSSSSVAPGQTGTFQFSLTAPNTTGTYNETFGFVADGQTGGWMPGPSFTFPITVTPSPRSTLIGGVSLYIGQSLTSPNGQYTLVLQNDGNLVIYSPAGPIWGTSTNSQPSNALAMQNDGNLVIYDSRGRPLWGSGTNGHGSSTLAMQNDGNLVIYDAGGHPTWGSGTDHNRYNTPSTLTPGQQLARGQILLSPNGMYRLVMQDDGNLVIYSPAHAIWGSGTSGTAGSNLVMQTDGNLVIYTADGRPLWGSGTNGHGSSTLAMQNDGNLVIYDAGGHPTWGSGTDGKM